MNSSPVQNCSKYIPFYQKSTYVMVASTEQLLLLVSYLEAAGYVVC